ncbi:hypothetical protein DFJ73DRAFT_802125 [Zopfochytrium polystomum]|nr:hypothetical protein DFJ73DRAFT_802125 [Zopfochytrium polystomum]
MVSCEALKVPSQSPQPISVVDCVKNCSTNPSCKSIGLYSTSNSTACRLLVEEPLEPSVMCGPCSDPFSDWKCGKIPAVFGMYPIDEALVLANLSRSTSTSATSIESSSSLGPSITHNGSSTSPAPIATDSEAVGGPANSAGSTGLAAGAIAGIAVGAFVVVAVAFGVAMVAVFGSGRRHSRRHKRGGDGRDRWLGATAGAKAMEPLNALASSSSPTPPPPPPVSPPPLLVVQSAPTTGYLPLQTVVPTVPGAHPSPSFPSTVSSTTQPSSTSPPPSPPLPTAQPVVLLQPAQFLLSRVSTSSTSQPQDRLQRMDTFRINEPDNIQDFQGITEPVQ